MKLWSALRHFPHVCFACGKSTIHVCTASVVHACVAGKEWMARGIKKAAHVVHAICLKYHKVIRMLEHLGNIAMLTGVAAGIREIETTAAGVLVIVIALVAMNEGNEA